MLRSTITERFIGTETGIGHVINDYCTFRQKNCKYYREKLTNLQQALMTANYI
jgi:hypothetical protein